jgi:zinc D-Ala-D-Ala carboxypeptidase
MISLASYKERIRLIHQSLNISEDYEMVYGLPLQLEASELVPIENDVYDRSQKLISPAADSWSQMKAAAISDGVNIEIVSAYRSVDYQVNVINKKRDKGEAMSSILNVVAAPGYSEHHTGRAVDIGTGGCDHLSETFEHSEAFVWLTQHAKQFSFRLSYPRNCKAKICFEPWHWSYV